MPGKCKVGSRAQVMNGTCEKTAGGLTKSKLRYNDNGDIVSIKASIAAKKTANLGEWKVKKGDSGEDFKSYLRPKKGTKAYKEFCNEMKSNKKKSSKKKSSKKKSSKKKSSKKKSSKKKSSTKCNTKSKKQCKKASTKCKFSRKTKRCSKKKK